MQCSKGNAMVLLQGCLSRVLFGPVIQLLSQRKPKKPSNAAEVAGMVRVTIGVVVPSPFFIATNFSLIIIRFRA